jgi:hypothetical protein
VLSLLVPIQPILKASNFSGDFMAMNRDDIAEEYHQYMLTCRFYDECEYECRSSILSEYIEHDPLPVLLSEADRDCVLHLHQILYNPSSSIEIALMMIEKYPAAVSQRDIHGYLPLRLECMEQCRAIIISKCIELYPEALAIADNYRGDIPLQAILRNDRSSIDAALSMIEKYPALLQHQNDGRFPLHTECSNRCRPSIISKCIELYPQALNDRAILDICLHVEKSNFSEYLTILSMIFTILPMKLYGQYAPIYKVRDEDIRGDPDCRRRILNLLPRHIFTPTHESDFRDLNWQPRSAMMMLLSQMKIQQRGRQRLAALAQLSIKGKNEVCSDNKVV